MKKRLVCCVLGIVAADAMGCVKLKDIFQNIERKKQNLVLDKVSSTQENGTMMRVFERNPARAFRMLSNHIACLFINSTLGADRLLLADKFGIERRKEEERRKYKDELREILDNHIVKEIIEQKKAEQEEQEKAEQKKLEEQKKAEQKEQEKAEQKKLEEQKKAEQKNNDDDENSQNDNEQETSAQGNNNDDDGENGQNDNELETPAQGNNNDDDGDDENSQSDNDEGTDDEEGPVFPFMDKMYTVYEDALHRVDCDGYRYDLDGDPDYYEAIPIGGGLASFLETKITVKLAELVSNKKEEYKKYSLEGLIDSLPLPSYESADFYDSLKDSVINIFERSYREACFAGYRTIGHYVSWLFAELGKLSQSSYTGGKGRKQKVMKLLPLVKDELERVRAEIAKTKLPKEKEEEEERKEKEKLRLYIETLSKESEKKRKAEEKKIKARNEEFRKQEKEKLEGYRKEFLKQKEDACTKERQKELCVKLYDFLFNCPSEEVEDNKEKVIEVLENERKRNRSKNSSKKDVISAEEGLTNIKEDLSGEAMYLQKLGNIKRIKLDAQLEECKEELNSVKQIKLPSPSILEARKPMNFVRKVSDLESKVRKLVVDLDDLGHISEVYCDTYRKYDMTEKVIDCLYGNDQEQEEPSDVNSSVNSGEDEENLVDESDDADDESSDDGGYEELLSSEGARNAYLQYSKKTKVEIESLFHKLKNEKRRAIGQEELF